MSIASWLGVVPQDEDLPWPTITPPEAIVEDRSSLFIGYAFPFPDLSGTSPLVGTRSERQNVPAKAFPNIIATLLSHLNRTVQPATVPVDRLPDHLRSAPPSKRGAMHDMYAATTHVLKFARDGSGGPSDWARWEGEDDDGEKWGASKIAKVLKEENAEDVIVFVSRWYGGIMLGPDRFVHITNVARATVRAYKAEQRISALRRQLEALDARAVELRASLSLPSSDGAYKPSKPNSYADLTEERGKRLVVARRKMIELLEKKLEQTRTAPSSTPDAMDKKRKADEDGEDEDLSTTGTPSKKLKAGAKAQTPDVSRPGSFLAEEDPKAA
ncbi:hypothetical protein OC861_000502 [Tilletia horrida]|nr:hypothetical protein OC861_000502 [Tilletia horrida]